MIDRKLLNAYIKNLKAIINTEKFTKLKEQNYMLFLNEIHEIAPKFFENYPNILRMIIDNDDLQILNLYLDKIDDINAGRDNLKNVEKELGYYLHDIYIEKK